MANRNESESEFVTAGEIAAWLRVHRTTVVRWDLPCVVLPGGDRRYPKSQVEAALRARREEAE